MHDGSIPTNLNDVPAGTSLTEVIRMLDERIRKLESELMFDADLRARNPALQDIYEQYQTVKVLVQK